MMFKDYLKILSLISVYYEHFVNSEHDNYILSFTDLMDHFLFTSLLYCLLLVFEKI